MCIRLIMEKLHGGNWLLVDAKGREWGPKRCHKGGACKGLFYMRIIALLDKLESLNGPFSHYKPVGHETFLHNQEEFPINYYISCFSHTFLLLIENTKPYRFVKTKEYDIISLKISLGQSNHPNKHIKVNTKLLIEHAIIDWI